MQTVSVLSEKLRQSMLPYSRFAMALYRWKALIPFTISDRPRYTISSYMLRTLPGATSSMSWNLATESAP